MTTESGNHDTWGDYDILLGENCIRECDKLCLRYPGGGYCCSGYSCGGDTFGKYAIQVK